MAEKYTERAIAYLKSAIHTEDSGTVKLSQEDSPVLRAFSDDLCIAYLADEGSIYHYIQNRHLDADGVSETELHEIGLRNLVAKASQGDLQVQAYGNIFAVLMGGDFEASLILLDPLWDHHFRQFIPGDYAIAIPARDILAFCDRASDAGLDELRQLVGRIYPTGDHLLTDKIYVRNDGQWSPEVV